MVNRMKAGQVLIASGLNVLVGLYEIAAPWVFGYEVFGTPTTNEVIVGIIVAVLAATKVFGTFGGFGGFNPGWVSWINALLGVWLIVAPFILGYTGAPMVNDIFIGIVITVLGAWSALATRGTAAAS